MLQFTLYNVPAVTPPSTTPTIVWHQDFSISDFANNYNVMIQTSDEGYAMTGMAGVLNLGNIGPWLVNTMLPANNSGANHTLPNLKMVFQVLFQVGRLHLFRLRMEDLHLEVDSMMERALSKPILKVTSNGIKLTPALMAQKR